MTEMGDARLFAILVLMGISGCSSDDDDDDAMTLSGTNGCEKLDSLSAELGCTTRCADIQPLTAECDGKLADWMDCIARDLSQCHCESDGDLNCEGSYKPDEGSALCQEVFAASEACF
jgi:hypothetical protein